MENQTNISTDLKEIWNQRGLIKDFVRKDFLLRYAGSVLGSIWNIIHPLVMIAIYTLVFSKIMRAKLPGMILDEDAAKYSYSIYLCVGLIPWGMFSESLIRSTNILLENGNLIKKVSFPSELLHISALGTSAVNFLIAFSFFVFFLWGVNLLIGYPVDIPLTHWLMLGFVLIMQQIFAIGLGFAFSVLNVFFRDIGQVISIIVQLWFWFTPVVYMESIIPDYLAGFLKINPMYYFIHVYHSLLFEYKIPEFKNFAVIIGISMITFFLGFFIYRRLKPEIADEL